MSYKYSKGSQVVGDLKAADDAERNTKIDFGEDQIEFQTSGSTRLKVDNQGIEVTGSLISTGDITVGGNDLVIGQYTGQADLYLNAGSDGSRILLRGTGDAMSAGDNIGAIYFDATENDGVTISTAGWMIAEPTSTTYTVGSDMPTRIKFGVCRNNQSSPTDTLYIDGSSTGNPRIGILDSTPSYTLDVNGDIRVTDDLFVDDFARIDALRVGTTSTDPGDGNLHVEGNADIAGSLSFEDYIMAELSIAGLDLQTDTNAFTFNCPYNLDFERIDIYLDTASSSGTVTVTVTNLTPNPDETIFTASITSGNTSGFDSTASNASVDSGDQIRFTITAAGTGAQGLRANVRFRRRL